MYHIRRNGKISTGLNLLIGSFVIIGILGYMIMPQAENKKNRKNSDPIMLYCAAGVKSPIADSIKMMKEELGINIEIMYGGTGMLLNNFKIAKTGDIYLAADTSFIDLANQDNLIDETIPLAKIRPVIAVTKGNPKNIHSLEDFLREDVKFALANPGASIGKLSKEIFEEKGNWDQYKKKVFTFKPTVNDILLDVTLKSVDAAIVWDANARQKPDEVDYISVPELDKKVQEITIAVLKSCKNPAASLKVCRYLQSADKGQKYFDKYHYELVNGDEWKETPKITLYSGGVNRLAIQDSIKDFEKREGVEINVNYNGCGILVSMMNTGIQPDIYFACDGSYMDQVQDKFNKAITITETAMVIITQKGNPKNIKSLQDFTQKGLKVGLAHHVKSALGKLSKDLLTEVGIYDKVKPNIKVDSPTADFLVNQLRTGSIDASIVYAANVAVDKVKAAVDVIPIQVGHAKAVQPIAISKQTKHPYLAKRLVNLLISDDSKEKFEKVNFTWKYPGEL